MAEEDGLNAAAARRETPVPDRAPGPGGPGPSLRIGRRRIALTPAVRRPLVVTVGAMLLPLPFWAALTQGLGQPVEHPFILMLIPVLLAGWWGGLYAGLAATLLAVVGAWDLSTPAASLDWSGGPAEMLLGVASLAVTGVLVTLTLETLRRQAAQLLAVERERRGAEQRLVAQAPVALAMFDARMRYLACSAEWKETYGLAADVDLTGRSHYEVFPDLAERWRAVHRRVLEGTPIAAREDRFDRADGSTQWVNWDCRPWRTAEGAVGGLILWAEDVTRDVEQREAAANAIRESEERYRSTTESATAAIISADDTGRIVAWNASAERIFGWTAGQAIGQPMALIMPERFRAAHVAGMERLRRGAGPPRVIGKTVELQGLRKDGSEFPLELSLSAWRQGGKAFYTGMILDISARKAAESALRVSEERLRSMFEHSAAALCLFDRDARFQYANPAYARLVGWPVDDIVGRHFAEVAGKLSPGVQSDIERVLRGETIERTREVNYPLTGRRIVYAVITPMRDLDGGVGGWCSSVVDLTEIKQAEQALARSREDVEALNRQLIERARQADAASRAKSDFLSTMSHELRTPLNALLGHAHLLSGEALAPDQRRHVDRISNASRHLLAMISDALDLAAVEAGELQLHPVDFSLAALVVEVEAMLQEQARHKGLALSARVRCESDRLHGDAVRLRQCLLNYAGNAIKFTDRGAVAIAVDCVASDGPAVTLRFEVRDTGIGIARDKQGLLFQPFQQVGEAQRRREGGTGLGLAITRRIAERMGGEAGCTSEPGVGSTFWFTARLEHAGAPSAAAEGHESGEEAGAALRRRLAGARVLVAEDDPVSREMMHELLARQGIAADVACDGREALDKAAAVPYGAVLMDMQMPVMDGLEATQAIRRLPGREGLPIVALTANALARVRSDCLAAGLNAVATKPVDPALLFRTLLDCLGGQPAAGGGAATDGSVAAPAAAAPAPPGPADYPGLHLQAGLARWGGMATYAEFLRLFASEYGDAVQQIRGLPADRGARQAHRLRGAAASLALDELAASAAIVQECLEADGPAADALSDLEAVHDTALASIAQLLSALDRQAQDPAGSA